MENPYEPPAQCDELRSRAAPALMALGKTALLLVAILLALVIFGLLGR